MPAAEQTVRLAVPRKAWVIAGAAYALLLLAFGVMITQLEDTRTTIDRQLAVAARQSSKATPLLQEARPLVKQLAADQPAARRLTRRALTLTREATPLVRDLNAADAGRQLRDVGTLAGELLSADVGRTVVATRRLADMLMGADIPRAMTSVNDVAAELTRQNRLRRLLVRSTTVLGEMQSRHFVQKVTRASEIVPELLPVLRQSLDIQTQTLAIAREAERHAESLDRKFGGPLPGTTQTPAPAVP